VTDTQACQVLLDRLLSGASVRTTEIYKCLNNEQERQLKLSLSELREQNAAFASAKEELREYTRKVQTAAMLDGRSETLSYTHAQRANKGIVKGRKLRVSLSKTLSSKVDSLYEDALEILDAALVANPYLQMYLDRNFDLNAKTGQEEFSADRGGVPRLHFPFPDSNQRKISILQSAISDTQSQDTDGDRQLIDTAKLKSLLKTIKGT